MNASPDRPSAGIRRRLRGALGCAVLLGLCVAVQARATVVWTQLRPLAEARLAGWSGYEVKLRTPAAGRDVLPAEITGAVGLLEAARVTAYRLSPALSGDDYAVQRISELAWPISFDPKAPLILRRESEAAACPTLSTAPGVALDRCE